VSTPSIEWRPTTRARGLRGVAQDLARVGDAIARREGVLDPVLHDESTCTMLLSLVCIDASCRTASGSCSS